MRKLLRIVIPGLLLVTTSVAFAHGPVRKKVVEKINIGAAPDVVWGTIKNFGDMAWLPGVKSTDSANLPAGDGECEENSKSELVWVGTGEKSGTGSTPCATRTLTLDEGGTIEEVIKDYSSEKMEYAYKISKMSTVKTIQYSGEEVAITTLPVSNYSATIQVKEDKKGGSEVTWKAAFYRGYMKNNPPPELTEDVAVNAVTGVFKKGLGNLKTIAEGK
ncbi:MAG: SRPBCC family protein [Methylococcaceae bacterium]|nr:SRPBCC family protein [Methylococcaceae bacterium]